MVLRMGAVGISISILVVMTCFAANSVITRYLVQTHSIDPVILTIIRFVSALATIQLVSGMVGNSTKAPLSRRDIVPSLFLGVYAFSISFGYVFISAAAGALIFYTFVVTTMSSLSVVRREERITVRLLLGSALGLVGVAIITFSGITNVTIFGSALMAMTGVSWGFYSVFAKKYRSYFTYSRNTFFIFGVFCIILAFVTLPVVGYKQWTNLPLPSTALALYMGAISTALSYLLWGKVMGKIRSSQGGIAQLLVPVFTSILAVLFLNEEITATLVAGGVIVLCGIYLNAFRRRVAAGAGKIAPSPTTR